MRVSACVLLAVLAKVTAWTPRQRPTLETHSSLQRMVPTGPMGMPLQVLNLSAATGTPIPEENVTEEEWNDYLSAFEYEKTCELITED